MGGKANVGFGKFDATFEFEFFGKIYYENNKVALDEAIEKFLNKYTDFIKEYKEKDDYFDCLNSKNKVARKK